MKLYSKFLVVITILLSSLVSAQQDAQYTQYMYNTIVVNPAYAGSRGVLNFTGLHRSQWVGLDGAPRTQTLSIHSPLGGRVGLGGSIVHDEIGPTQETYANVDFSYTIPTGDKGKLALGLKAGVRLFDVNFDRLDIFDDRSTDPSFINSIEDQVSPTIGIGIFYYTDKFYLGLSAPNLLETRHLDRDNLRDDFRSFQLAEERVNYYVTVGRTFDLTDNVKFKPALFSKIVFGSPLQVDLTANFLLYEKFTVGAAYRWSAAISALVGFQVSDTTMIGFAYDRETTELGNSSINDGSFELFIRFEMFKQSRRIITPRFF